MVGRWLVGGRIKLLGYGGTEGFEMRIIFLLDVQNRKSRPLFG